MEFAKERKKALQIESYLLSKISVRGQTKLAKMLGLNEAAVSRLKAATGKQKYSTMKLMSLILAYAGMETPEFDLVGTMSRLEKKLERMEELLAKKKATALTVTSEQLLINF
ncbi:CII family transcriptional regulator [Rosenbergiella epipactidis]|uniref:CII family transcriptional regulator n=1 Tax=Rosenbergiella epipactidis TaxID=1544694 RepID=UPI001F4DB857|nr:CII family transcriptional regulator [Rosenbergiella epipactidis]